MEKTKAISIRVDVKTFELLEKAAKQEDRSLANYILRVLKEKLGTK